MTDERPRVVIAEDEAIIRLDLCEILAEEGFAVVGETGRGDEVIDLVRAVEPDLALLDIKMPGLDGLAVARALSSDRRCAVVLLTAFSQRELIAEAADAGAHAYVVKPFQPSELAAALHMALARYRDTQVLAGRVEQLERRLDDRKVIERAKGVLMARDSMAEDDAFALLRRRAMDGRTTMRAVADQVLSGS